jgi:hypothetical protein
MATVSDITSPTLSGLNYIDALLDKGPAWNYRTGGGDTLLYTFSVTSGNDSTQTGQRAFSLAQQSWVHSAFDYIAKLTGIQFTETANGAAAQLHLANIDISGTQVTGLCSWTYKYSYNGDQLVSYDANAYVYLDNVEWGWQNSDLMPGGYGYETLLHELGHALGLKHPFREPTDPAGTIVLPTAQDNTANTLMSYTDSGGPHALFSQYDIAALNWIYGGDGLAGALGMNSTTGARYFTGTSGADALNGTRNNDTFQGNGGNDMINGGEGTDTAVFNGAHSAYTYTALADGKLQVSGSDGIDTLSSIEILHFTDGSFQRSALVNTALTLSVAKNGAGYATSNTPQVSGSAQAGSTVKVYFGSTVVGTAKADATGLWTLTTDQFADGMNYAIYAKATDAAGNTSAPTESVSFNVDATPPAFPTGAVVATPGGNQPVLSGTGEAGTTIQLVRVSDAVEIGRATVGADGKWHIDSAPLPNGTYDVSTVSLDAADNAASSFARMNFTISSVLNSTGTAGADVFKPGAGNNGIDGQGGLDVAVYDGTRASFTVAQDVYGFAVTDKTGANGHDTLVNVERVQFSDAWVALDIDGVAGQAYRMYRAAFDRTPDLDGLGFWIRAMDNGSTVNQIAAEFIKSKEFNDMYMSDPSDANFITQLYAHVLHRPPEGAGYQYWLDNLQKVSRAEVLAFFTDSQENQAQVIGSLQGGIAYTHLA